jgi:small subunit ribosomal protein S2
MVKKIQESSFNISLKDLLEAGCHFGHQSKRWNPKMSPYIWQTKDGVHIFDLVKTAAGLKAACLAVRDLVSSGKNVVFLGTKRQSVAIIKEEATKVGMPHVSNRWLGGTITNWAQVKKSIDRLLDMKEKKAKGEYEKYTKRENVLLDKEAARLSNVVGGLVSLKDLPDAIFVVDTKREYAAVREAKAKGIKVFGIVDSNCDPELVDYVIPANDDAVRSIKLITSTFALAVAEGLKLRDHAKSS